MQLFLCFFPLSLLYVQFQQFIKSSHGQETRKWSPGSLRKEKVDEVYH